VQPGRGSRTLPVAVVVAAALAAHWPALQAGYVLDDDTLLADNPYVRTASGLRVLLTSEFFLATARPEHAAQYRPVSGALNWVSWQLLGGSSVAQHALNLAMHAGVAVLLLAVLRRAGVRQGVALAMAALFAVHPATTLDVSYAEGRQDLLGWALVLGAALAALRWRSLAALAGVSFVATLLATHCREAFAGTFVGVALLALVADPARGRVVAIAVGGGAAAVATVALRHLVGVASYESQPWSVVAALEAAVATGLRLARDVVLPTDLALLVTPPSPGVGPTILVLAAVLAIAVAIDRWLAPRAPALRPLAWAAWGLAASQAAVYAIVVVQLGPISDRYAYGFVVAAALVGAALAQSVPEAGARGARIAALVAAGLVVALLPVTWSRSITFRSEATLQAAMAEERPDDPETQIAVGLGLLRAGDLEGAQPHCTAYARAHPRGDRANLCLGLWRIEHGKSCEALPLVRPYALARPGYPRARQAALAAALGCNDLGAAREMLDRWEPAFGGAQELVMARRELESRGGR
jgi:hypothetical protein